MKTKNKAVIALIVILLAGLYYYVTLPAVNIHSSDTWFGLLIFIVILMVWYAVRKRFTRVTDVKESKVLKSLFTIIVVLGIVYLVGSVISSPIINARKYQKLMTVTVLPLQSRETVTKLAD